MPKLNPDHIIYLARHVLIIAVICSLPVVLTAAVVGLLIGVLQSVFSVQDSSLAHAARAGAVVLAILLTAGWVGAQLLELGNTMFLEMTAWKR